MSNVTLEEAMSALGGLASCISIPASSMKVGARFSKSPQEIEKKYLETLRILSKYYN